jgi:hypothetical protein
MAHLRDVLGEAPDDAAARYLVRLAEELLRRTPEDENPLN